MAVHPVPPNHERREAHSNLERDPRFLRKNDNRPVLLRHTQQLVEDGPDRFRLSGEMRSEGETAASVRLVGIRELPPAIRTTPQRSRRFRRLHAFSCRITPPMSTKPHASTARSFSMRQTLNRSIRTFLP